MSAITDVTRTLVEDAKLRRDLYLAASECAEDEILKLQTVCSHKFDFISQINAFHTDFWDVKWECLHCDLEKIDLKVPPICTKCQSLLHRALDAEAEIERSKPEYNNRQKNYNAPEAWRCSVCNAINILWTRGD